MSVHGGRLYGREFKTIHILSLAHYLLIRLRTFTGHVLRPLLGFIDWWDRFEWQARGSGHLHALFWIPGAPPLNVETEEACTTFAQYWGAINIALNLDLLQLPDARNPSSLARRMWPILISNLQQVYRLCLLTLASTSRSQRSRPHRMSSYRGKSFRM